MEIDLFDFTNFLAWSLDCFKFSGPLGHYEMKRFHKYLKTCLFFQLNSIYICIYFMYDVFIDMRRVLGFFLHLYVHERVCIYFTELWWTTPFWFSATLDSQYFHEKIRPKFEQISFFREEKNGRKKGEKTLYLVNFY